MALKLKGNALVGKYGQMEEFETTEKYPLELKVSPNGKYVAVCNIIGKYADVFEVDEPHDVLHLYTLKKNTYRTEDAQFMFEFFVSPSDPEDTLFIFNKTHGEISVYNTAWGIDNEHHTDSNDDKFITKYKVLNNEYLYIECWYWQPIFGAKLYKLNDLLTVDGYSGVTVDVGLKYPSKDCFKVNQETNMVELIDNDVKIREYTLQDFYENHKEYEKFQANIAFTRRVKDTENSLLKMLNVNDYDTVSFENDSREKLAYILGNTDEHMIYHSCVGNNSGSQLDYHALSITGNNKYEDLELHSLVPKLLFGGHTSKFNGLPEITLTFTFTRGDKVLKMLMNQKMKVMDDGNSMKLYEIDDSMKCYITFS